MNDSDKENATFWLAQTMLTKSCKKLQKKFDSIIITYSRL